MFHHGEHSIIKLVIVNIEHNLLCMQRCFFASTDDLGNVDSRPEELEMLHSLLRFVFRVENGKFSEHCHVGTFKSEAGFH